MNSEGKLKKINVENDEHFAVLIFILIFNAYVLRKKAIN